MSDYHNDFCQYTLMPNPSASSNIFCHAQIFLTVTQKEKLALCTTLTVHLEKILKFDIRPYSSFKFGSLKQRPKAEKPSFLVSSIPLIKCIPYNYQ